VHSLHHCTAVARRRRRLPRLRRRSSAWYAGTLDAEMSFLWAAGFLRTLVVGQLAVEGAVEQLDPPCKLQQRGA
jgi:hypothetical protein